MRYASSTDYFNEVTLKTLTEVDYCPMTGDQPEPIHSQHKRRETVLCLFRYIRLPPETTDKQAEHARAMLRCHKWERKADGSVVLYDEM